MAVGTYEDASFRGHAFAAELSGARWTIHYLAVEKVENLEFDLLSCASAHQCMVWGTGVRNKTFPQVTETWNGTRWTVRRSPSAPPRGKQVAHQALRCVSAHECVMAGWYSRRSDSLPWLTTWNGRTWRTMSIRNPSKTTTVQDELWSVDCPSSSLCVSVGNAEVPEPGTGGAVGTFDDLVVTGDPT